jgi:hypothetical protein
MGQDFNRIEKYGIGNWFLHGIGTIIARLYRLLFGRLDERSYQRNRKRFTREVKDAFSALMLRHGGGIVPHEGEELPRAFDYVAVTVEFEHVRIRLISGREELGVRVAPSRAPKDWQDIRMVLLANHLSEQPPPVPARFDTLSDVAELLSSRWEEISSALAESNYEATKEGLRLLWNMPREQRWEIKSRVGTLGR